MTGPTTLLLLAGLAAGQPGPVAGQDVVKRVAERLQQLDPGASPNSPFDPKDLEAIKKFLDANPTLKAEVDRRLKDFNSLPPEAKAAKLAELDAAKQNPAVQEQIRRMRDGMAKPPNGPPGQTPTPSRPAPDRPNRPLLPKKNDEPPGGASEKRSEQQPNTPDGQTPIPQQTPPPGRNAGASPQQPPPGGGGRGFEKFASFWEKNVGPLKEMPAVQQLAQELFRGAVAAPADGDAGPLGGLIDAKTANDLLKGLPDTGRGGAWQLPDFGGAGDGFDRPSLPQAGFSAPDVPSASGAGLVFGVLAGVGLLVAIVLLLPRLKAADGDPTPVPGLGPWPLDPRTVATRADVVRAFEYLSVLVNGSPARAYSHEAAAAAFREAMPAAADAAEPLADAYALARYTPAHEPLTAEQIADARRHLCRLAGVPAP